jgi:hypothetical protein
MITDLERITRTVYVYAKAKTKFQIERLDPDESPFEYVVKDYDYGDESQVRIMEVDVDIIIPSGIDLTRACIENLREKIGAVEKEAKEKVADLEDRIRKLALIEYRPNDVPPAPNGDGYIDHEYDEDWAKPGGTL